MPTNCRAQSESESKNRFGQFCLILVVSVTLCLVYQRPACSVEMGELDLTVVDAETKQPIAARLRIQDARGRPPRIRGVPRIGNDFTFRDTLTFELKPGKYHFLIEHGPEYKQQAGFLQVDRDGFDQKTIALPRFANLRKKGYFAGDLYCPRDREHLELLMSAEDLSLVVRPSWNPGKAFNQYTSKRDRTVVQTPEHPTIQDHSAGVLQLDGGRLLIANVSGNQIVPSKFDANAFAAATHARSIAETHIAVLDPWAWDMPMLVAHELVDSVAVLGDALQIPSTKKRIRKKAKNLGFSLDDSRFNGEQGTGRFAEHIYFQLLNCGLHIAPSACSGSGETNNPPGYNRAYVACGADFSPKTWYNNLRLGKSIISNGPMLSVRVNDQLPGHTFQSDQPVKLEVTCELATRQKVEYLEIIKNGRVLESVRLDKWAAAGGVLPLVEFEKSGWMLIRAHAVGETEYRCAFSAPFYVNIGDTPHVSRASAEFFAAWVLERGRQLRKKNLDKTELRVLLDQQKAAYNFWKDLGVRATTK